MALSLAQGARVADKDGNRGTVRYVGPVATSKTAGAVYAGEFRLWPMHDFCGFL
jgi:hypothetical protein